MFSSLRICLLAGCLLSQCFSVQAQAVAGKVFGLRPSKGSSQQVVNLGDTKSRTTQVLGPPTKTSRFYAEIDNAWWLVLHYGSNQLFFQANRLVLAELHDARLTVGRPGTAGFHVGSALPRALPGAAKPPLAFGNFNVDYKPGKSRNLPYAAVSYGNMKTDKGQVVDVLYEILYDQHGRVAHIFLDETYD